MAMEAHDLGDNPDYLRALWYGDFKQGKTTAMAGLARMGKIVAVSTEGRGWLRKPLADRGIPVENIKVLRAPNHEAVIEAFWEIHGMLYDGIPIVGVLLDHWTSLEAATLQEARELRISKKGKKLAGAGTKEAAELAEDLDPYSSELPDYGVWTNKAKEVKRLFNGLPCHVGHAAHMRTVGVQKMPDLTEKFRNMLAGEMNMVIGTTTMVAQGEQAYVGVMRSVNQWAGGDDLNVTPSIVVNPSFDRLVLASQGKLNFETDPEQQAFKAKLAG